MKLFYIFTVSVNKCDGSCNTIDDPYADDEKATFKRNNCLIHTTSSVVICLLLDVVSVSCYYYYKRYFKKQKYLTTFSDAIIKLREISN